MFKFLILSLVIFTQAALAEVYLRPGQSTYVYDDYVICERGGGGGHGGRRCSRRMETHGQGQNRLKVNASPETIDAVCRQKGYSHGRALGWPADHRGLHWVFQPGRGLVQNRGGMISEFKCCN